MGATSAQAASVAAEFDAIGLAVDVSDQPYSLVASPIGVVEAFVIVTSTTTAGAFLSAMAAKVGGDSYDAIKRVIHRLRTARASDRGRIEVILRGENGGPDIVIGPDTPDAALGRLLTGELPDAPSGTLVYDPAAGRWKDSRDSA